MHLAFTVNVLSVPAAHRRAGAAFVVAAVTSLWACDPGRLPQPSLWHLGKGGSTTRSPIDSEALNDPYDGAAHTCASTNESTMVLAVNAARRAAGVAAMRCLPLLTRVAASHAMFLAANEGHWVGSPHGEEPGWPFYTGVAVGDRADAVGINRHEFWLSEGVGGGQDPEAVVAAHLATVYHRSQLLTPGGRYFGAEVSTQRAPHAVLNTLAWTNLQRLTAAVYPGPGQEQVPTVFSAAGESPDPTVGMSSPGFPISLHFPRYLTAQGEETASLVVRDFRLLLRGQVVPTRLIDAGSDVEVARSDVFLVPRAPLIAKTTYTVKANVEYGASRLDGEWRFETR